MSDFEPKIKSDLIADMRESLDFASAFERTLAATGAGVVLTGLTLAVGVATWIFAALKLQADMGAVLSFMFLVNMVGAIVLLPALGAFLMKPKRARGGQAGV